MAKKPNAEERYRASLSMKPGEDACKICGAPTKFTTTQRGYLPTCGRRCGGIYLRQNLKSNPDKFDAFKEKMRVQATKMWADRTPVERATMADKIRATVEHNIEVASPEERKRLMGIHKMASTPVTWLDCDADECAQVQFALCDLFGMDDSWIEPNRIACIEAQAKRMSHG